METAEDTDGITICSLGAAILTFILAPNPIPSERSHFWDLHSHNGFFSKKLAYYVGFFSAPATVLYNRDSMFA